MGTRGIYGFIVDGVEKIGYNHSDSYPSWLGTRILNELRSSDIKELADRARRLQVIEDESRWPTPEQISEVIAKTGTPNGDSRDWYWLLRDTQGDLEMTLRSGYVIDYADFARDSLFCEWGYLVNFDTGFLEIYKGFQTEPHAEGRFSALPALDGTEYYPVRLIAAYSLGELPEPEQMLRGLGSER